MIICGIDPSLKATAVVVGSADGEFESRVFSSYRVDGTVKGRFARYENQIASLCDFLERWQPDVAYIEDYVFGRWDVTPITEYGAMLRWNLLEFCPVIEIAPTTLKKFATGHGGSKKSPVGKPQVMQALTEQFGVFFNTEDEYDAYAAWRLGCLVSGVAQPTRPHELECVQTVVSSSEKKRGNKVAKGSRGSTRKAK